MSLEYATRLHLASTLPKTPSFFLLQLGVDFSFYLVLGWGGRFEFIISEI
jgi:hypothetical protein